MEIVHIFNILVLGIGLLLDYTLIRWNRKKKVFTKGETAFWCVAIIIWTFWAYYMIFRGMI